MVNFTPGEISEILAQFFDVAGKRQYVGARYVPLFGRKDESSIEWDNTKPYEPLTIVLYQGNSYTSRQYVPSGIAITNEVYWALTGNYNAQVELYRRETTDAASAASAAQNDIETLLPKASFSAENTVKDYIDKKKTPIIQNNYTVETLIEVGTPIVLNISQGMAYYDGYLYMCTYQSTTSNTFVYKIDPDTCVVVDTLNLGEYAHANCVSVDGTTLVITGSSKLMRVDLTTFTLKSSVELSHANDVFITNNGAYAMGAGSWTESFIVYSKVSGKFVPYGAFDFDPGFSGMQDASQVYNNIAILHGHLDTINSIPNCISIVRFDGSVAFEITFDGLSNEPEGLTYDSSTRTFYISDIDGKIYKFIMPSWFTSSFVNTNVLNDKLINHLIPVWIQDFSSGYEVVYDTDDSTVLARLSRFVDIPGIKRFRLYPAYFRVQSNYVNSQAMTTYSGALRCSIAMNWSASELQIIRTNYDAGSTHTLYLNHIDVATFKNGNWTYYSKTFTETEDSDSFTAKVRDMKTNGVGGLVLNGSYFGLHFIGDIRRIDYLNSSIALDE